MNIIASNITNVNTTRTPQGGPYLRKELICIQNKCEVKESTKILSKYEPDHLDADNNGYVSYPDINLAQEIENMIIASRDFEEAANTCK